MRIRKCLAVGALGVSMVLMAAGCGSSDNSGAGAGRADLNKMSDAQLYQEAKKEGQLTWYTSMPEASLPVLVKAFNEKYPDIKVQAVYLSGQTPITRVQTEARAHQIVADLVSGSGDAALLQQDGLIDESYVPADGPKLPGGIKVPPGSAVDRVITNVIEFNPTALQKLGLQPPTSIEDLTKPEWKGKWAISPTTSDIYNGLKTTQGAAKALDLIKRLGANGPVFVTSHSLASSQVTSGAIPVALAYGQTAVEDKKANPTNVDFVNPNPLPVNVSEVGVIKGGPHPAAARLFTSWLVGSEGQQQVANVGMTSMRDDVKGDPLTWDPGKWPPSFEDPSIPMNEYNKDLKDYQNALGYHG